MIFLCSRWNQKLAGSLFWTFRTPWMRWLRSRHRGSCTRLPTTCTPHFLALSPQTDWARSLPAGWRRALVGADWSHWWNQKGKSIFRRVMILITFVIIVTFLRFAVKFICVCGTGLLVVRNDLLTAQLISWVEQLGTSASRARILWRLLYAFSALFYRLPCGSGTSDLVTGFNRTNLKSAPRIHPSALLLSTPTSRTNSVFQSIHEVLIGWIEILVFCWGGDSQKRAHLFFLPFPLVWSMFPLCEDSATLIISCCSTSF